MLPLVSCIIPTCDRREYLPAAINCYQQQLYALKELIVVDNGQDAIEDLVPTGAKYLRIDPARKVTTGEMRNRACALAAGTLIAHFDDDDWSHPRRLIEQVRNMQSLCVSVGGYNQMYFIWEEKRKAWLYTNPDFYALGTSLVYTRDYWRGGKFPDKAIAEDTAFIERAQRRRALTVGAANDRLIARIHEKNTSDKKQFLWTPMWTAVPYEQIRRMIV
jgi:glycosyltransferase involved in cell wall biosynthesis